MLSQLWSNVRHDPALVTAFVLVWFAVALMTWQLVVAFREARQTTITTAAELRKDAATPERRRRLRVLQGRFGTRRAS